MLSASSKNAFKMAPEDPQKNIAKKYEKYEFSDFFSNLWGLNYQS